MIGLRFFLLRSADVRGEGTRDARLRMSAGEATIAPHYQDFDFKLTSDAKIQPVFLKVQAGKTLSYHDHALVTLYVQFLYSDWSKFGR